MTVQIAGKYTFASQENFEEYLKAEDIGMLKRNVLASTKPDIVVEVDGDQFTITTITKLKTIKMSFPKIHHNHNINIEVSFYCSDMGIAHPTHLFYCRLDFKKLI